MNLTLFFRLILMSIFQKGLTEQVKIHGEKMDYKNVYFQCPVIWAMDGWHVSIQIMNANYCASENGYRQFGHTIERVEWGFPSGDESLLKESAEEPEDVTHTVGSISLELAERIFAKHGGVDWEKTISVEQFERFMK